MPKKTSPTPSKSVAPAPTMAAPYAITNQDLETISAVGFKWLFRERKDLKVDQIRVSYDPASDYAYTDLKSRIVLTNRYLPLNLRSYEEFVVESLIGICAHETGHLNEEPPELTEQYLIWIDSKPEKELAAQIRNIIEDSRINYLTCMRIETRVTTISEFLSRFLLVMARAWLTTLAREEKQKQSDFASRGKAWPTEIPPDQVPGIGMMLGVYGQWYNPNPPLGDGVKHFKRLCHEYITLFWPNTKQEVWDDILSMEATIIRATNAVGYGLGVWNTTRYLLDDLYNLCTKYDTQASKILPKPYGNKPIYSSQKDVNKYGKQIVQKIQPGGGGGGPQPQRLPPLPFPGPFDNPDDALKVAQKIAGHIKKEMDSIPEIRERYRPRTIAPAPTAPPTPSAETRTSPDVI